MSTPFISLATHRWPPSGEAARPADRAALPPAGFQPLANGCPSGSPPPAHVHTSPQVTFEREDDRVTRIRIECGCGEVIALECLYD